MNRIYLLLILLLAVVAVPFAAADTIQLTQTNLGAMNVGSVTLATASGGVMVTLSANPGFSLKVDGSDILFNTNVMLTASNISTLMVDNIAFSGSFKLDSTETRAGEPFAYDLVLKAPGVPSANTISFVISGVTVSQLEQTFTSKNGKTNTFFWGTHFCEGSTCTGSTGFAFGNTTSTVVPEPGTLSLLGTGIIALAGFMRKRFLS